MGKIAPLLFYKNVFGIKYTTTKPNQFEIKLRDPEEWLLLL